MATKNHCFSFKNKPDLSVINTSNGRYSNLNLNQKQQALTVDIVHSNDFSNNSKKVQNYGNTYYKAAVLLRRNLLKKDYVLYGHVKRNQQFQIHWQKLHPYLKLLDLIRDTQKSKSLLSWKRFDDNFPSEFSNIHSGSDKKKSKEGKDFSSKNKNSSTLTLHIAAYENSVETVASDSFEGINKDKSNFLKNLKNDKHFPSALNNPFEFPRQQWDYTPNPAVMQFTASQQLHNPNQGNGNSATAKKAMGSSVSSANPRILPIMSTSQATTTERFHVLAQLEHLQSRYTGCGHADTNRWDWLTNQHRDTSASLIGHPDHLSYLAVAKNHSRERARIELLDKMIQPCGPPPKRTPLDDI